MRIIVSINDEHLLFEKGKDINTIVEFFEGAVTIRRNYNRTGWEESYKDTNIEVTAVSDKAVSFFTPDFATVADKVLSPCVFQKEPEKDDIPTEEATNV